MDVGQIVWKSPTGDIVSCYEKNKVMAENIHEILGLCQDALEDAVLMGCDEFQFKAELARLIGALENPYRQANE